MVTKRTQDVQTGVRATAFESAAARWERLARARSDEISLAEGALLIAAEEYEDLDVAEYLQRIDAMGAALRQRLREDISTSDALVALNRYIFEELGFSGNADDYYDPRNSYLNDVIERKLGIPITLSVVYIEIGRRIGLPLQGVSFPSHFLVTCALRDGTVVLDPFAGGASLGLEDLQERLRPIAKDVEFDERTLQDTACARRAARSLREDAAQPPRAFTRARETTSKRSLRRAGSSCCFRRPRKNTRTAPSST